jgi:predicted dehydrogenase
VIRTVLCGAGRWGARLLAALERHPDIVVETLVDPDPRARRGEGRGGRLRHEPSLSSALRSRPDLVVIATPPALHAAQTLDALEAGADVFVEKPLALGGRDARTVRARARALGRVVAVGHVLRFHPAYEAMDRLVREGAVGTVTRVAARRLTQSGTPRPLWALAPHDLATLRALDGTEVDRVSLHQGVVLHLRLRLESGIRASFELSTAAAEPARSFVVRGDRGALFIDERAGTLVLEDASGRRAIEVEAGDPLDRQIGHLVDCVRARTGPRAGADEGTWIVETLERAERAPVSRPVEAPAE